MYRVHRTPNCTSIWDTNLFLHFCVNFRTKTNDILSIEVNYIFSFLESSSTFLIYALQKSHEASWNNSIQTSLEVQNLLHLWSSFQSSRTTTLYRHLSSYCYCLPTKCHPYIKNDRSTSSWSLNKRNGLISIMNSKEIMTQMMVICHEWNVWAWTICTLLL